VKRRTAGTDCSSRGGSLIGRVLGRLFLFVQAHYWSAWPSVCAGQRGLRSALSPQYWSYLRVLPKPPLHDGSAGEGKRREAPQDRASRLRAFETSVGQPLHFGVQGTHQRRRGVGSLSRPLAVAASLDSDLRGTTGIVTGPSEKCGRREAKWQDRGPPAFPRRAVAPAGPDASQLAGET
jgi:hypothetical protein